MLQHSPQANPCIHESTDTPFHSSEKVVAALTDKIVNQVICAPFLSEETTKLKAEAKVQRRFHKKEKLEVMRGQLPKNQQRLLECAQGKGASNWITTMPFEEYDYFLHKDNFRNALCLRYSWHLNNLSAGVHVAIQCLSTMPLCATMEDISSFAKMQPVTSWKHC